MKCPRCQHENPAHAKFCLECGAPFKGTHESGSPVASDVDLQRALSEALDQQTATAEILRVISSSPTDIQSVFAAVVASAARLCDAFDATIFQVDGDVLRLVAHEGPIPSHPISQGPPLVRGSRLGRAVLDRRTVHVADAQAETDEYPEGIAEARRFGHRTALVVPLLRSGEAIGAIAVRRTEVRPFSGRQIALLKTFADQAVIAIENVRLFKELEGRNAELSQALDQQIATGEILRVISRSPTNVQPVFDTIVRNAVRLCGALHGGVYTFDGELVHARANEGYTPEQLEHWRSTFPRPVTSGSVVAKAIRSNSVVLIDDLETAPAFEVSRETLANLRVRGSRSLLAVPMTRHDEVIGAIGLAHGRVGAFSAAHVELLKTFADQAVIAIENVRLFTELQEKNRALTQAHSQVTETLEQQTATSEILRVIASSPTDERPVFETIVGSALRLLDGHTAGLRTLHGNELHMSAFTSTTAAGDSALAEGPIAVIQVSSSAHFTRVVKDRTPSVVEDAEIDSGLLPPGHRLVARARGYRSGLTVPLLRGETVLGVINVTRRMPGPFSADDIALLQTFADQAVIAIENVRLFKELQARTQELTRSVDQLTALGEVGQAVSSTLDLDTVLTTIVSRAVELAGTDVGAIYEYDDATEQFRPRAEQGLAAGLVAVVREIGSIRKGEGAVGRVAVTREPIQIADMAQEGAYQTSLRQAILGAGIRSLLAVPLLRQDRLIGCLVVNRKQPGDFAPEVIALLKRFATQSALAIQNARLFREIEEKSRQLEVASQHKSEFLANMSHELRTPLNAIIGFSEVLSERMFGELNEKQEEYSKDIHASGQHLLSLINDILDLSKIEAGRMELELTDFHLPQAIDNALILIRERAGRRGITLEHSVDERLGEIRGDERKVKQVLLNLLSNALKFSPEGGRVDVRAAMVDGMAEISVTDTGVGIAPTDQDAIFEEFRQVGTAEKKAEGTGLGLTLCRKFVELHGGRIWVQSQVGVGSTFTFSLPVRCGE